MIPLILLAQFVTTSLPPVSTYTVACDSTRGAICQFDASKSKYAAMWRFDWGNGRTETRVNAYAQNTFQPGTYCVKLTVWNLDRDSSYSTKLITIPYRGAPLKACPRPSKPPVVVPPVKPETVYVKLPPDTVRIIRVDTLYIQVPLPSLRLVVERTPGEWLVYDSRGLIGRLVLLNAIDDTWQAYINTPGVLSQPCVGFPSCTIYPSQALARDALP